MDIFSLYWVVTEVEQTKEFVTRRNIKKPILFPRYQGSLTGAEVVCAYVGSKEIDPTSNLNMIRQEDSIPENSKNAFTGVAQWIGRSGYSFTKQFLLTDIVGDYQSDESEPFYWKHSFSDSSIDPDSVAILTLDFEELPEDSYYALRTTARDASDNEVSGTYESSCVFSNYKNSYSDRTGKAKLYYVRFNASGDTHYELLNSESAFSPADFEDISSVTGFLKPWRKVYILSPGTAGYSITTPSSSAECFLAPLDRGRVYLQDPLNASDEVPWFLNVTNGSFVAQRDKRNGTGEKESYSYSIPEFESQSFSPLYPYKASIDEEAIWINKSIIKVSKSPLKVDSTLYPMDVLLKDSVGKVLYAFTTKTSKAGDFYFEGDERVYRDIETDKAWVIWDGDGISGWDMEGGFIHFPKEHPDYFSYHVSYYYEETGYEVTSLNLNPVFDEDYDGQFYTIYVVPTGGNNKNTGAQTQSVHYIRVDRNGKVIDTSQVGTDGNYDLSTLISLEGEYLNYTGTASSTLSSTMTAGISTATVSGSSLYNVYGTSLLPPRGILVFGEDLNEFILTTAPGGGYEATTTPTFAKSFSSWVRVGNNVVFTLTSAASVTIPAGVTVRLLSFEEIFSSNGENKFQWLSLAEVRVSPSFKINDLSIIDLRKSGGVLKEEYYSASTKIDPRAVWARTTAIETRGQPTPGETASIIKIPYTILKDYGGRFKEREVEDLVKRRHLAAGVVPIILYSGAIPQILTLTPSSNSITMTWGDEGEGYTYNVYSGPFPHGPWGLMTPTPIGEGTYGNTFIATGLTSGVVYYFCIAAIDEAGLEGPKGTPWGARTTLAA